MIILSSIELQESSSAAPSPNVNQIVLYVKTDGLLYQKTSDGIESIISVIPV